MFTGLIREIGKIKGLAPGRGVMRVDVEAPQTAAGLRDRGRLSILAGLRRAPRMACFPQKARQEQGRTAFSA